MNPIPTCGQNAKANTAMDAALARVAADNTRRRPCRICGLAVLPETMARHMAACHDEDES